MTDEIQNPDVNELAARNAELESYIANELAAIKAEMAAMRVKPVEAKVSDTIDTSRPFSKTRTINGGICYEQDGKKFDAKRRLVVEQ